MDSTETRNPSPSDTPDDGVKTSKLHLDKKRNWAYETHTK